MYKNLSSCCLCGGSPIIKSKDPVHRSAFRFKCTSCGLTIERGFPTREEAAEAWEAINTPKIRTIDSIVVPCGYTLLPSSTFKELCDYVRLNNFELFKSLARYNIWHHNVPIEPPTIVVSESVSFIAKD
jgi:hypothetical protein